MIEVPANMDEYLSRTIEINDISQDHEEEEELLRLQKLCEEIEHRRQLEERTS